MSDVLLRTEKIIKIYKRRRVVDEVDIEVHTGEVVGLLGPNGAGKTTTFYSIVGIVRLDSGKIIFDGQEISRLPVYKRARLGIGYLSQETSVFQRLTVEENIMAILENFPLSRSERRRRLRALLQELNISHLAGNKAWTLSGGERRRLEITRALVNNPSFILLDEPFSGVDPIAVADIQEIIAHLKQKGIGVLLTDHNVRETLAITDRAYIIAEGKILIYGTSEELVRNPQARKIYLGEKFSL
ncbi:MAG: LPS export ABC transporter ATP-binding protein [Candidatus Omnitrophota bacterium]|nr:MAG: LPS export ABC transporter ATP-binding protein [Candidatus Omnitrophota bacterium]